MKLGYIHNSREEQTRVLQVLKMTSESVALDELGIGRIRALSCFIIMASSDIFRIQNISGGKQIITGLLAGFSLGLIFKLFLAII